MSSDLKHFWELPENQGFLEFLRIYCAIGDLFATICLSRLSYLMYETVELSHPVYGVLFQVS